MTPPPSSEAPPAAERPRSLDGLFAAAFALVGLALGARPIGDNSTLVHLRTGIDIVAGRGIPRVDPYSATAAGTEWVVQSWLPSLAYGLAHTLDERGGALLALNGLLTGTLAFLVHRLARASTPLRTLGAALVAIAVSGPWWSPRPLLVGLICFALTILVTHGGRRYWLLVPIAWVWVNSHGSFPLAGLWLLAAAVGAAVDQRRLLTDRFRAGLWFLAGLAVACLNPLGPRLLLFPLSVGDRREVFRLIVEWRPADFQSAPGAVSAVGLAVGLVLLARRRHLPLATALPAGVFVLLGLLAQRNLAPAGIVLASAFGTAGAGATRTEAPEGGPGPRAARVPSARRDRLIGALVAVAAAALVGNAVSAGALDLTAYPVGVVREADRLGVFGAGRLVATQDKVGCYLILRRGRGAGVFIDDRYDMYPVPVSLDYFALLRASPAALEVLDRRGVDTVLWERSRPLVPVLAGRGWRERAGDERWVLLQRPDAPEGGP